MHEQGKERLECPCKNCEKSRIPFCMNKCEKLREYQLENYKVIINRKKDCKK